MTQCQWITQPSPVHSYYTRKGGPCSRKATHTDGKNSYCTQHSKEFATVLKKATNRIRDGLTPITET